jgi:hypothetical protein
MPIRPSACPHSYEVRVFTVEESDVTDLAGMETRLRAVEDRLDLQGLAACFSDAVNERDIDAFFQLWACGKPIWEG